MKNTLRIIGGLYRGKKIPIPDAPGLRPTPDRVRETLFNWLMQRIRGASCLDAFAGTGALGLEAYSRGASEVTFLDSSSVAQLHLKKVVSSFELPLPKPLNILSVDALNYLKQTPKKFDIVFLDPPFDLDLVGQCLELIKTNRCLNPGALVYIEASRMPEYNADFWECLKQKQAGQVVYGLLQPR